MDCVGVERPSEILKLTGWSRKVTGHGVVYYVRRGTNESRWVHPGLAQCVAGLAKYDNISTMQTYGLFLMTRTEIDS